MARPLFAQGWEVKFGGNSEEQGIAIHPTIDHGFVEVGYSESFGSDNDFDIYVVRTDVDGTLVWENIYDEAYIEVPGDVLQLEDESYLIAGYIIEELGAPAKVYLLHIGPRGEFRWSKRFENNGSDQRGFKIIPTTDGGYAIVGKAADTLSGEDDILLLKLNAEAEEEWRETYGTDRNDEGRGIVETPFGYALAANIKGDQGPDNDIGLYMINDQGGLISLDVFGTENLNEEVNDLIRTSDGNLVLVGSVGSFNRGYIMKSDLNGDMLWELEIDPSAFDDFLSAVIEDRDGSLVSVGTTITTATTPDILLIRVSAEGELVWERNLGEEFQVDNFGQDLALADDGGFVIAGHNAQSGILINDMILLKVDAEGNYFSNVFRGKVAWTTDGCNPYEEGDAPLAGWLVKVEGDEQTYYGTTDESGCFSIAVDEGSYTVELLEQNSSWDICSPASFPIDFDAPYDTLVYNFPVRAALDCPVLGVNVGTPAANVFGPCNTVAYDIVYSNQGAGTAENAYVEITLDDELTFVDASIDVTVTDSSYIFWLGDLPPNSVGYFSLNVEIACAGVIFGQSVWVSAHIHPDEPCTTPSPDWDMSSIEVFGVCEDNQIRFRARNVGTSDMTAPQPFVVIEDQVMFLQGQIPGLGANEEQEVAIVSANEMGSTYRIIAQQVPGHPGASFPTVAVEGCTQEGNETNYTTGQVTQFPENDQDAFIDIDVQEIEVPITANTLTGHPRGYQDSIITPTTDLEYTIRFVNTGTDTLDRLVIRDTLPPELDLTSLQVGPASHPYEFTVYNGGVLKITFDNLNLVPDGGAEEADSRGFVKYALSQKLNNPLGTAIENHAAVYFDYMAPMTTNAVRHVVGCENFLDTLPGGCLLVVDTETPPTPSALDIQVLPNPFSSSAMVRINGCHCQEVEFILRDALGREVRRERHAATTFTFYRRDLPAALYFFELRADGQTLQTGKLLVQ